MEIQSISDVTRLIGDGGWKIFGVGAYPSTRVGLGFLEDDFEMICSEKTGEFDSVADKINVKVFDFEEDQPFRTPSAIISEEEVAKYINESSRGKKVAVYVYAPDEKLNNICLKNNWRVIGNNHDTRNLIESRLEFYKILKKINWPTEDVVLTLDEFERRANDFFEIFGPKIVVQFDGGGGGRSTMFFSESDKKNMLEKIKRRMSIFKIESDKLIVKKFFRGKQVSATGCITKKNGILTSVARNQLIDVPGLVPEKMNAQGKFCGNDFGASRDLSKTVHEQAASFVERVGKEIGDMGALGIFGVDFILDESTEKLVPLEINPRLLGTFPVSAQLELENGLIPLVAFHVLEFLGIDYNVSNEKTYKNIRKNSQCAHLIMSNFFQKDVTFKYSLCGGVYGIKNNSMEFIRNGFELQDIINPDEEFVIFDGVPIAGKICKKNKKLFRVIMKKSVLSPKSDMKLNPEAEYIVENVKKAIRKLV